MADDAKTIRRSPLIIKCLLWLCGVFLIGVIFLITSLFFLPRVVSTQWFKEYLETYASETIRRPLYIDRLVWTWSKGILLEGVRIADDPSFSRSPIISIDRSLLALDLEQLLQRRLAFSLEMDGLEFRLIRNPDGQTNLGQLLSRIAPPRKQEPGPAPADWRGLRLAVPMDVKGHVRLRKVSISIDDRSQGRSLTTRNTSLLLEIPSLAREPITLVLSSELIVDGIPVPPLSLSVHVKDLVDPESFLNLSKTSCRIEGGLPGLRLLAEGVLSKMGVKGQLDLDLAPLSNVARPFLPPSFPNPSGTLQLTLTALLNTRDAVDFSLILKGSGLAASGGPLKTNRVGPLHLVLSQEGTVDINKKSFHIRSGKIQIQENSRLSFQATVRGITDPQPQVDLTVSSLFLDLKELLHLGKPFVPSGIAFGTEDGAGSSPELRVKNLRFTGSAPEGPSRLELNGLSLWLPVIRLKTRNGALSAKAIRFQLQTGDMRLESNFPTQANVQAALKLENLHVTGEKEIRLKRLIFPTLRVVAKDMARSRKSFFGLKGNLSFHESGTLEGLTVGKEVRVPRLTHTLKGKCTLKSGRPVTLHTGRAVISAPAFHLEALPHGPIDSGLDLDVDLSGLHLIDLNPLRVDVERVRARLDVKDLLNTRMEASIHDLGRESLKTEGNVTLNIKKIVPLLATYLPNHLDLQGIVDLEWKFQGRLPTDEEKKVFSDTGASLYKKLQNTRFLEDVRVTANLKDVVASLPLSKNGWLKASQIRTDAPLTLDLSKGMQKGSITGKVVLGSIKELPLLGRLKTPLQVSISLSGTQEGLRTVRFSETIDVEPLGLSQSLDLSLNRIDQLLKRGPRSSLPMWLEKGEGSITAKISASSAEALSFLKKGVALKGSLEAGAQIDLTGENELRAKGWLESPGLDVKYGPKVEITDLKTHLALEKTLLVGHRAWRHPHKSPPLAPLSKKVLQTEAKTQAFSEAQKAVARRLMDDLRGRLASRPAVTFKLARIEAGTMPLEISNYELDLRLVRSLPSIDHFQFDIMGGSVVGELYVTENPKGFEMEAGCTFSGLNPNLLLPRAIQGTSNHQPESLDRVDLSGQLSLQIPLTTDPTQFLYGARLTLRLTHIGSRTFERFLYALDPYESNEGIVKQRELLRVGTPLWITLQVRYGNLSLSGEVEVKGVRMRLPRIERFNIAGLPIHARLEDSLSALGPLMNVLKTISADGIILGKDGAIRMMSSGR